jgi:hypothetical protein
MFRKRSTWPNPLTRGVRRAVLATGLVVVSGVATAGAASAGLLDQQSCIGDGHHTICVYIASAPFAPQSHSYRVNINIDIDMTRADAQNIIDGGGSIGASVYGEDLWSDNQLTGITRKQYFASDVGLSAEFDRVVNGSVLDEDWEGQDEVYALVRLYVPVSGNTRTFRSDTVDANFFGGPLG